MKLVFCKQVKVKPNIQIYFTCNVRNFAVNLTELYKNWYKFIFPSWQPRISTWNNTKTSLVLWLGCHHQWMSYIKHIICCISEEQFSIMINRKACCNKSFCCFTHYELSLAKSWSHNKHWLITGMVNLCSNYCLTQSAI